MRVLVTGGGGFLGRNLVARLLAEGMEVRSLARGEYPELRAMGVEVLRGDLGDPHVVRSAVVGCDAVFHVGAKAGVWGSEADFQRSNVIGTRNVLQACREEGVGRLVHTSSPSVVHAGRDIEGADESLPIAEHHPAPYPRTKAIAERAVLAANGPDLSTVALRPHLIWGPGDTQLTAKIVDRARTGRLRLVGDGSKLIDTLYIDNAVDAHILALQCLGPGAPCAGRAYFVTNGEPRPIVRIINGFLHAAGLPSVSRSIPPAIAMGAAGALEIVHKVFRPQVEPMITRFLVEQLSTAHWFDISAARRDLGFIPRVSIDQGMDLLARSFR